MLRSFLAAERSLKIMKNSGDNFWQLKDLWKLYKIIETIFGSWKIFQNYEKCLRQFLGPEIYLKIMKNAWDNFWQLLFCLFIIRTMVWIFTVVKNRHLNLSAVLKLATTQNEPKTTTSRNEATASNNDSRPIFPYYDHSQTGSDNPFINERGFIYLGILKMSFIFKYFQEFKVAYHQLIR